jgi:septal ring factor EnvC (AmiA/AmiB activator)
MQEWQEQIEQRLVRLEQQTEPINLRIERGLPVPEATLLQKLMEMSGTQATDIGKLKGDMGEVKAIVANIKATVSDQGELLKEYGKRFDKLEATQNEHGLLLQQILDRLPPKP